MSKEIIGNQNIQSLLNNSIKTNNISHSYLFSGPDGIGKKLIAKEFAKKILCLNENKLEENNCKSCLEFDNNNNPDFQIIQEAETIKIEQIRKLQEKVYEKPIISNKKVYIIDNAENMTPEAQNCLLKTLEEYIVIILITSNENNLLQTIKSRCLKISFNPIETDVLITYLKNNLHYNITNTMLKMYEGSIGKAIKINEKIELYNKLNKYLENLEEENIIQIINNSEELYKGKENINEILEYFNVYFMEKAKEEYHNAYKYLNAIKIVEETKRRLKFNSNYDMSIDNLLINIWEEFRN